MGKNKKLSKEDKGIMAEAGMCDWKMREKDSWTHCLFTAVSELETSDSVKYLAQKAHCLLEKEHHDRGDLSYLSIFRDPDSTGQDPGG